MNTNIHRKSYCVVIGGLNLDIQAFCYSEYQPGDSNPGQIHRSPGGVGRNIAENLLRLGLDVELMTMVGDSSSWDRLISRTEKLGISLAHSPRIKKAPLSVYLCILGRDGDLVGAVADMRAMEKMQIHQLQARKFLLDSAEAIVVDGNIPQDCIEWIAMNYGRLEYEDKQHISCINKGSRDSSASHRPLLIADPVSTKKAEKFISSFGKFDLAKPNINEAAKIAGLEQNASIEAIALSLREKSLLPKELYISQGGQGMSFVDKEIIEHIPLSSSENCPHVINRSGAGDAACAALAWISLLERRIGKNCKDSTLSISPRDKAKIALSSAIYASSSNRPVNPHLDQRNLFETTRICYPETSELINELIDAIQMENHK